MGKLIFFISVLYASSALCAQDEFLNFDVSDEDVGIINEENQMESKQNKVISSFISSRISDDTAKNIENAEKVFCYTVANADANYTGYKIHSMKITGSCGELSKESIELFKTAILANGYAFSSTSDSCMVEPKLLIRYIRGIDTTDVVLSDPCHAVMFFHDADAVVLNASPIKEIISELVNAYSKISDKFLSPALMDQMVANGVAVSQGQKEIERRLSATPSVKKWNTEQPKVASESQEKNDTQTKQQPEKTGWNKFRN